MQEVEQNSSSKIVGHSLIKGGVMFVHIDPEESGMTHIHNSWHMVCVVLGPQQ